MCVCVCETELLLIITIHYYYTSDVENWQKQFKNNN